MTKDEGMFKVNREIQFIGFDKKVNGGGIKMHRMYYQRRYKYCRGKINCRFQGKDQCKIMIIPACLSLVNLQE
jgi:hypothetical protein